MGAGGEATKLSIIVVRWSISPPKLLSGRSSSLRRLPRLRLAALEMRRRRPVRHDPGEPPHDHGRKTAPVPRRRADAIQYSEPACRGKKESDTAPNCDSRGRLELEIVQLSYPDRSIRLSILQTQPISEERWFWYADRAGRPRRVTESLTDHAALDGFVIQAAGRCAFRLRDLRQLADRV